MKKRNKVARDADLALVTKTALEYVDTSKTGYGKIEFVGVRSDAIKEPLKYLDESVYAGERNIHNFEELLAVFNAEIDRTKEELT